MTGALLCALGWHRWRHVCTFDGPAHAGARHGRAHRADIHGIECARCGTRRTAWESIAAVTRCAPAPNGTAEAEAVARQRAAADAWRGRVA